MITCRFTSSGSMCSHSLLSGSFMMYESLNRKLVAAGQPTRTVGDTPPPNGTRSMDVVEKSASPEPVIGGGGGVPSNAGPDGWSFAGAVGSEQPTARKARAVMAAMQRILVPREECRRIAP